MNDDELGRYLGHSIERRVGSVTPRVDLEELLVRTQRRLRQRRVLVAAAVAVLVIGVLAGYVVGHAGDEHGTAVNAALDDGAPRFASPAPPFEPANVGAAMAAIEQAFHSAFDGGVDPRQKADAIQTAAGIESLTQSARRTRFASGTRRSSSQGRRSACWPRSSSIRPTPSCSSRSPFRGTARS